MSKTWSLPCLMPLLNRINNVWKQGPYVVHLFVPCSILRRDSHSEVISKMTAELMPKSKYYIRQWEESAQQIQRMGGSRRAEVELIMPSWVPQGRWNLSWDGRRQLTHLEKQGDASSLPQKACMHPCMQSLSKCLFWSVVPAGLSWALWRQRMERSPWPHWVSWGNFSGGSWWRGGAGWERWCVHGLP